MIDNTKINVEYAAGLMKYLILIATEEAIIVMAKRTSMSRAS